MVDTAHDKALITEKQCRAARAWLGISQDELARLSGVSTRTIAHFETASRIPHARTLRDIMRAFERLGIELQFEGLEGVGLRAHGSK